MNAAIVVTGGPGGGKTTALDLFQRELKDEVKIVPEAATLLFGHGLSKDDTTDGGRQLQHAIYRMQLSLEEIFHDFFADRLLICDRGTLDGAAYWPADEESFFESIGSTFDREASRYSAVIFFQTAAARGEDLRSNNPYRSESLQAAVDLDQRLRRVWERHPHFHFIPSEPSFVRKIMNGLTTIRGVLASVRSRPARPA
jgi:predicted ATPase